MLLRLILIVLIEKLNKVQTIATNTQLTDYENLLQLTDYVPKMTKSQKSVDKIEYAEPHIELYLDDIILRARKSANISKLLFDNGYQFKFHCPLMTNELIDSRWTDTYATCDVCKRRVSIVNDIEDFNDKIDKGMCVSFDPKKLFAQEKRANQANEIKSYRKKPQRQDRWKGYISRR